MDISTKLINIADRTPSVCEAIDSKRNHVSGDIVSVDDVVYGFRKKSKNLFDYLPLVDANKITVNDETTGEFTIVAAPGSVQIPIKALDNTQYYVSGYIKGTVDGDSDGLTVYYTDGTIQNIRAKIIANEYVKFEGETSINKTISYVILAGAGGMNTNSVLKQIQIELGTTATEYEPYYEVPPAEHDVKVRLKSKNIVNFPKTSTTRNVWDNSANWGFAKIDVSHLRGKTITYQALVDLTNIDENNVSSYTDLYGCVMLRFYNPDGSVISVYGGSDVIGQGKVGISKITKQVPDVEGVLAGFDIRFSFYGHGDTLALGEDYIKFSNPIVELGDTATEYTPYISVNKNLLLATDFYQKQQNYSQLVEDDRNCVRFTDSHPLKYNGLTFEENTQYTVSFWCKTVTKGNTSGDATSRFFVFYYTDGTKSLLTQKATNGEWVYTSLTSTANKTISYIGMDSVSYMNWLYVDTDTFQLEKGTTATEYEPYGTNFTNMRGVSRNLFNIGSTTECYSSSFAVRPTSQWGIENETLFVKYGLYGGAAYWNTNITHLPKGQYTLSCEAYIDEEASTTNKEISLGFIIMKDGNKTSREGRVTVSALKTWQRVSYNFNLTEDVEIAALQMQPVGNASNYSDLDTYFKNIQIEKGSTATQYQPFYMTGEVRQCGANLFPFGESVTIQGRFLNGTHNDFIPAQKNVEFLRGKEIRYSAYFDLSGAVEDTTVAGVRMTCYDANGASLRIDFGNQLKKADGVTQGYSAVGIKVPENTEQIRFDLSIFFNSTATPDPNSFVTVSQGMVKFNLGQIEYEPYTETIYTASPDGTVKGVKSISPNMTLIPNTKAVTVECSYFPEDSADTLQKLSNLNKAFDAAKALL